MSDRGAKAPRILLGAVLPGWVLAWTAVPWLITAGSLPDPMASHFRLDGTADGSMPVAALLAISVAFALASAGVLVWTGWRSPFRPHIDAAIAAFVGWLVSTLNGVVVLANQGHPAWREVTVGSGAVFGAIASACGAALPVALLVRADRSAEPPADVVAGMALGPDERVAWFGGARSAVFAYGAAVLAIGGAIVLVVLSSVIVGLVLLAGGLLAAAFASVEVAVSEAGVRVRSGALAWPAVVIPMSDIQSATACDLRPARWGGWGYRGSMRLFGRAAWVLRAGPALELDLVGGRRFAVTVDGAVEAAAVVNGVVERVKPRSG